MPCPHFDVKIIQRSKRQSAVASAAYQSGERLFSEYDQKQKYYSHKSEIVHTEILLPPHAPPEYADRNTLWNAAEAAEKQWNSQLARRFVLAIPRELPRSQCADLIRVNMEALAILSTLFAKDHLMTEGAQIINVSSIGGYFIGERGVIYTSTKFFVNAFTEGLAQELIRSGAKLRAKVLAPAETETKFKLHYLGINEFDYQTNIPKYHTARQMAGFLMELYDSDSIVGKVNRDTYEFELRGPVYPFMAVPK